MADAAQTVESYRYLGLSTVIGAILPEPNIVESVSLDSFGNVGQITWTQGGTLQSDNTTVTGGTALVNIGYGYDGVGDVLWRGDEVADPFGQVGNGLDQAYSYDAMHRLTGYTQGTLNVNTGVISSPTASGSWSLDSQGNRYNGTGVYATTYNTADQAANTSYSPGSGNTTSVTLAGSGPVAVTYDAWGRVVKTYTQLSGSTGEAGDYGDYVYSTYQYDALGRIITTTNFVPDGVGGGRISGGQQTYYDGSNPIQVRELDNSALVLTNVWSPADGRLILRDAVAAQLSSDMGLSTIQANTAGGVIQRLYPITDGLGSIVAVADPSGVVQERYVYDCNGLPQAVSASFASYNAGFSGLYAQQTFSRLGWDWLYEGQHWTQVQPNGWATQWQGLYVTASGVWNDPMHARALQPNLYAYGDPHTNPYQMSALETFGADCCAAACGNLRGGPGGHLHRRYPRGSGIFRRGLWRSGWHGNGNGNLGLCGQRHSRAD